MRTLLFTFLLYGFIKASCIDNCVLSSRYWVENENKFESFDDKIKLWPTSCNDGKGISEFNSIFNNTSSWSHIMKSKRNNICINFAKQYITINLNICRGTCVNEEIFNVLTEASDILETQCEETGIITIGRNSTKFHRLNYLDQLFLKYNSGDLINEKCGINPKIDCNNNGVIDSCEISYNSYLGLCSSQNGLSSTMLSTCKVDKNVKPEHICEVLAKGKERDCNNNHILDSCEIASKNGKFNCGSVHCRNFNSIYDFPKSCIDCKSDDFDNDGIPDMCQSYELLNFQKQYTNEREFIDCNSDGIDDDYSLFFGFVNDTNNNNIPDDCEFGSCCNEGICTDTSIDRCNITYFSYGVLCSQRDDCFVLDKNEEKGSCCTRTSGVNPILLCQDDIKFGHCENISGFWSGDKCSNRNCGTTLGSCCSYYNSTCYGSISYDRCSALTSKMFIFDKKSCSSNESICNNRKEVIGTCVHSDSCIKNISIHDCVQLMGIFDTIPCQFRLDLTEDKIGSCCTTDNNCIDMISRYKCISIGGTFNNDTCGMNNFCNKNILEDCCIDNVGYCLHKKTKDCSNMLGNFSSVKCNDYAMCNLLYHTADGCCLLNGKCMKSINETQCLFFNGNFLNSTGCIMNKICYDNVFSFEVITKIQSKGLVTSSPDRNANIAIDSNDTGAVVSITVFSVIIGILFFVFVIYSIVIIYNRPIGV